MAAGGNNYRRKEYTRSTAKNILSALGSSDFHHDELHNMAPMIPVVSDVINRLDYKTAMVVANSLFLVVN